MSSMLLHCNMIDWRIDYEAINTVTVQEVSENDSYEIRGKKVHYYIEGSTDMGIIVKLFFCKIVFDSVASNNVSFSDNHAFYCFTIHDSYLTIDVQYSPYWYNSKQLGPGHMLLPHWKLLFC